MTTQKYDDTLINFYDDQIISLADLVYRFGIGVTLSLDGALELTRSTFQNIASRLAPIHAGEASNMKLVVLSEFWRQYQAAKGRKFPESRTKMIDALRGIDAVPRAAMIAVDLAGLTPSGGAKVLGLDEKEFRVSLAAGRRQLMKSNLDS